MSDRFFRYLTAVFSFFVSLAVYADSTGSSTYIVGGGGADAGSAYGTVAFSPTPGDVSVVFLGNIFGVVDGVLAGSGSQIVGEMFGVFNSAVLSLGGIILLYTLLVSTLNTAHEGQMLGQKWSSIWVPIRSTVGIGLLLPKASGYCTMQIFVMWVVVQGIGAADSIWSAALNYLNSGGVIVQKQMASSTSAEADNGKIMNAAMGIATAQLCMQALQSKLAVLRDTQLSNMSLNPAVGPCHQYRNESSSSWYKFCNNPIPDFLNTVNITSKDNLNPPKGKKTLTQYMPNFTKDDSPYDQLKGICGQLTWNIYGEISDDKLSKSEQETIKNSRSIAVYQMYTALVPVTRAIIGNAPVFNSQLKCTTEQPCVDSTWAQYDFGMPLTMDYKADCKTRLQPGVTFTSPGACTAWGTTNQDTSLFNGKELQDAVAAYNGVMLPTLSASLLNKTKNKQKYDQMREFIRGAESKGWLMAGAYFFKLAILNSYVIEKTQDSKNVTDTDSGLLFQAGQVVGGGDWKMDSIIKTLSAGTSGASESMCPLSPKSSSPFCSIFSQALMSMSYIITGSELSVKAEGVPNSKSQASTNEADKEKFDLFTYLKNANSLVLPTQTTALSAGLDDSAKNLAFNPSQSVPKLGDMSFGGGKWGIAGSVTTLVWNGILKPLWNMLLGLMMPPIMTLFSIMIQPIIGLSANIFNNALEVMKIEGVNPILAIANMGTRYIDGVGNAWMAVLMYVAPAAVFPPALALIMCLMPVVMVWMGVMLMVGFSAAYYVPFVPLLMFTFAGIGWFIGVIEGMVAAPIVALGVTHPEGHEAFGKSEQAFMLLLSMFLRPAMMVLGYIFGIILSYVGVWIMNAGFELTVTDIDGLTPVTKDNITPNILTASQIAEGKSGTGPNASMYGFWSKIFLFYFTILTYSTLYVSIVQQAFTLIYYLPDKVIRWIGGTQEQLGEGAAKGMTQEVKSQSDKAGGEATKAQTQVTSGLTQKAMPKGAKGGGGGGGGGGEDSGGEGGGGGAGPAGASGSAG